MIGTVFLIYGWQWLVILFNKKRISGGLKVHLRLPRTIHVAIYIIKVKVVSGVTLLVPVLPSDKTPNYPPIPLIFTIKAKTIFVLSHL
jgi:hypothetical protein